MDPVAFRAETALLKVIVVEDSAVVRDRLVDLIEGIDGVKFVASYEDAPEAIAGIRAHVPHLVLLDIKLRTSNGLDVLKFVKRELPQTQIIALTNYAEPHYRRLFLSQGANYFLDKSNEFDKVRELLQAMTRNSTA